MKFYQIRYQIRDKYLFSGLGEDRIKGACRIIGAKDEITALRIAKEDLEDDGWEIIKIISCKEIAPTYVKVQQAYFHDI